MGSLKLSGNILSVRGGGGRSRQFTVDELRLAFMVTTAKVRFFAITGGDDLLVLDLDDENQSEGIDLLHKMFLESKPGPLSGFDICLADYEGNMAVLALKSFKKEGIDIIDLLGKTRERRVEKRKSWLACDPTVTLKGRFGTAKLNRQGYFLSSNKSLRWDEVGQIQINKQESLITTTHLLVIPQGVGGGFFSMKKFKYALKGIPNKLANLYLSECSFWRNQTFEKNEKKIEEEAMRELVRDGIVSGSSK